MSKENQQRAVPEVTPLQIYLQAFLFSMCDTESPPNFCFDTHAGKPISFKHVDPSFVLLWNSILTDHLNYLMNVVEQDEKIFMLAERLTYIEEAVGYDTPLYRGTPSRKALKPSREARGTKSKLLQILESSVQHAGLSAEWFTYLKSEMEKLAASGVSHRQLLRELEQAAYSVQSDISLQVTYMKDTWAGHAIAQIPDHLFFWYCGGYTAVCPREDFPVYHTEKNTQFLNENGQAIRVRPVGEYVDHTPSLIYMLGQLCELSNFCDQIGFYFNNIAGRRIERVDTSVIDNDMIFVDLWNALLHDHSAFESYVKSIIQQICDITNEIEEIDECSHTDLILQIVIDGIGRATLNQEWKDYLLNDAKLMFRDHHESDNKSTQKLKSRIEFSLIELVCMLYRFSLASERGKKAVKSSSLSQDQII